MNKPLAYINLARLQWKLKHGQSTTLTFSNEPYCPPGSMPHHRLIDPVYTSPEPGLKDPEAVYHGLLRGDVARPTWEQIKHVYQPEEIASLRAEVEELRAELSRTRRAFGAAMGGAARPYIRSREQSMAGAGQQAPLVIEARRRAEEEKAHQARIAKLPNRPRQHVIALRAIQQKTERDTASKETALAALKSMGILTEDGEIHPNYGGADAPCGDGRA